MIQSNTLFAPIACTNLSEVSLASLSNTGNSSTEWTSVCKPEKKNKPNIFSSFNKQLKENINVLKESNNIPTEVILKLSKENPSTDSRASSVDSRAPYIPRGIIAILDAETKQIIREVLPNNGKNIADTKIISMISTMKNNSSLKLIDFKRRVVMILHQAIKKDRGPLVNKIVDMWNKLKFPLIELIDSTCDSCKPITQAAWCGSIDCFRVIVANDTTNTVLQTINSKGESLDRTLLLGKSYALSKDPSNAVFIEDRFDSCLQYLKSALITQKRHSDASSVKDETSNSFKECSASSSDTSPEDQLIPEITEISSSDTDIILKIISVYGDNIELAKNYYLAAKKCVSEEIFKSIEDNLLDNGISFK